MYMDEILKQAVELPAQLEQGCVGISVALVTMTQDGAIEIFKNDRYELQRTVRGATVNHYAALMASGQFEPAGILTYAYSLKGVMRGFMDGQHRIRALAVTPDGKMVFLIVIYCYETDEELQRKFVAYDRGLKRSAADVLVGMGLDASLFGGVNWVNATVSVAKLIDAGLVRVPRTYDFSDAELKELAEEWLPECLWWQQLIKHANPNIWYEKFFRLKAAPVMALAFLTKRYASEIMTPERVEKFWLNVITGGNTSRWGWENHLIHRIKHTGAHGGGGGSARVSKEEATAVNTRVSSGELVNRTEQCQLFIHVWNDFYAGKTPKNDFKIAMDADKNDPQVGIENVYIAGTPFEGQSGPLFRLIDRPFVFNPKLITVKIPTATEWGKKGRANGALRQYLSGNPLQLPEVQSAFPEVKATFAEFVVKS